MPFVLTLEKTFKWKHWMEVMVKRLAFKTAFCILIHNSARQSESTMSNNSHPDSQLSRWDLWLLIKYSTQNTFHHISGINEVCQNCFPESKRLWLDSLFLERKRSKTVQQVSMIMAHGLPLTQETFLRTAYTLYQLSANIWELFIITYQHLMFKCLIFFLFLQLNYLFCHLMLKVKQNNLI